MTVKENFLTPIQQRFILQWGEMGARWGINRTVAQIHALLFLSARPLHAEEIAATVKTSVLTDLAALPSLVDAVTIAVPTESHASVALPPRSS